MKTLRFFLHSTDPNYIHLFDPLNNLRVTLPTYFTYHVDSFRVEPARMIGIIANVPFCCVDWNNIEGVLRCETERDMGGRTTIKVKSVLLDFQTKEGTRETKAIANFGTSTVSRKMLKICHTQALRDVCKIGDGISVSVKALYRTGKSHNRILHTHEYYINSQASIELRRVGIHNLEEPATRNYTS